MSEQTQMSGLVPKPCHASPNFSSELACWLPCHLLCWLPRQLSKTHTSLSKTTGNRDHPQPLGIIMDQPCQRGTGKGLPSFSPGAKPVPLLFRTRSQTFRAIASLPAQSLLLAPHSSGRFRGSPCSGCSSPPISPSPSKPAPSLPFGSCAAHLSFLLDVYISGSFFPFAVFR